MITSSLSATSVRVILLDDHPLVLRGLSEVLNNEPGLSVVGACTSSDDLFRILKSEAADVVAIDFELTPADTDGLNLIKMLNLRYPKLAILVVSSHSNPATVALALRGGAKGFIGKHRPPEEVVQAIFQVQKGKVYLDKEMIPLLAQQQMNGTLRSYSTRDADDIRQSVSLADLSPKEQEVIRCFITGMTVTDIADKFNRSLKTISGQKQSALRKLGLKADHELFIIKDELLKKLDA